MAPSHQIRFVGKTISGMNVRFEVKYLTPGSRGTKQAANPNLQHKVNCQGDRKSPVEADLHFTGRERERESKTAITQTMF